ncbi:MAG: TlpA family protein disulfide reductase, partial [Isosphaeraceae bacterium]
VSLSMPFAPTIVAMPQSPDLKQNTETKNKITLDKQITAQGNTESTIVPKQEPYSPVDDVELQKQVDQLIKDFNNSNRENRPEAAFQNQIDNCRKMIDLGLKNPKSKAAQVAWSWVLEKPNLNGSTYGAEFMRAATLLLMHHGDNPYVASQSLWMDNIPSPEHDLFIYGLNTTARSPETIGHAKLGLANYLQKKAMLVKYRKKITDRGFIGFMTKNEKGEMVTIKQPETDMNYAYGMQVQFIDPDSLEKQSLQLYDEVIRNFADIPLKSSKTRDLEAAMKLPSPELDGRKFGTIEIASIKKHLETNGKKTLGSVARAKLDEIQNFVAGKPAPEIEAEGVDGKKFKLSDYRGKAVLLVFWGTWCGPCMAEVPHERKISEKYKDKPFTIIGVNCDEERQKAAEVIKTEKMNWPNFYDGAPGDGPISQKYHIRAYPTTFLIDANGIIR